jgi:hypothetical protein
MSEGRPSKRRKEDVKHEAWPERTKKVFLRLLTSDWVKFELDGPIFMRFEDIGYLKFNSHFASYLYYICACLFEVMEEDMTLYFSPKCGALEDDDDAWEPVESKDFIQVGEYLVVFESCASTFLLPHISDHLVPNLDLSKVKPKKGKAAITEEHITPSTSSTSFAAHQTIMMPPTKGLSSSINSSPQSIKSNKSFMTTDSKRTDRDPRTRQAVVGRDMSCVVTNVSNDMCNCSHIIPAALLTVPILAYAT